MPKKRKTPATVSPEISVPTEIKSTAQPPIQPTTHPPSNFIVDRILPKHEIHLFGGPSHSGKTTLLLQLIDLWRNGRDVFGHRSYPAPFVYMSCGRSLSSVHAVIKRANIDPDTEPRFNLTSTVDAGECKNFEQAYTIARNIEPDLEVLFIDGIHHICPGKENSLKDVSEFLAYITRRLQETGITLVGVGHSSKTKGEDRFSNPRERFLGSSAWGTGSSTMIIVERCRPDELQNNQRKVLVMPTNAADQVFDYSIDINGMFQPDLGELSQFDTYAALILFRDQGTEFFKRELLEIAQSVGDQGLPLRTAERYIKLLVDQGKLQSTKWGKYVIPIVN
jgi:AAA domain-containing protein